MTRLTLLCIVSISLPAAALAQQPRATVDRSVDFANDVIPLLTKHGCNAGACHGAAIGRGGFQLSLYGGDPTRDYDTIVRQLEGRRINLTNAAESLLLLKPTEFVEHGGGTLFDHESESARLLTKWVDEGATFQSQRQLTGVDIAPRRHVVESLGDSIPLRAIAHYADGTTRDVTRWTIFQAEDDSAVEITDSPAAKLHRHGRQIVVARYLSHVVPIELIAPLTDEPLDLSNEPRENFIDDQILDALATLRIPPSPIIDDATFLRRITLDLTGRLPTRSRLEAFLADPNRSKREALVEELLASNEFTEYWTLQFTKLLRIRPRRQQQGATAYHEWLTDRIRNDTSYQQIARELILAQGDAFDDGPANFYRTVKGPREQAEFVSELFMGSRLRCANCHNHPLDRWTQDDYHGLAAIFARVDAERVVALKPSGVVIHPRTLEAAVAKIPGGTIVGDSELIGDARYDRGAISDYRQPLADWLTDDDNPYFAKAIVNRLWQRLMGRGLVTPVDDFRDTNPATHPRLLDMLAEDFVANGYRLRHTLRTIATSAAYARSANALPENATDDRFYSHAKRQPLEVEVLADAISDVLGVGEIYGDDPQGTRAAALIDPETKSLSLDILGRCGREESCETAAEATGGLPRKLHLFNGALLNARLAAEGSRLRTMLAEAKPSDEIVAEFYLIALNRHPTNAEREHWHAQLATLKTAKQQQEFLEDFVWGILTCNEFVTNH